MSHYVPVTDIAKELGLSVPSAYRYVDGVSSIKDGRRRLYDLDQVKTVGIQKAKKATEPALDYSELGSSAFRRWGESIAEERLRALRGKEGRILLREMRLNDPVIAAVFLAIENSLRKVSWRVKAASEADADKECATFVDQALNDMAFSFNDELQFVLSFLEQGFCAMELCYKERKGEAGKQSSQYNDGRIGWWKWAPRPADSLASGKEWMLDENGGIHGIRQEVNSKIVEIPIEKMLLFRTTVAPANSPEGLPIHRGSYTSWYYSNQIAEVEGIGIERDLAGIPVIYMGADTKKRGANSDFEQAKDIVTNLRNDEQAGVVFPYAKLGTGGDNRGILLELISTSGRRSYNTSAIISRYDKLKALSILSQFIMLGMEAVGSYALGRLQADIFMLAVSAWATNIAETINRFAIPRLLKYNVFPGITGMPKIVPSDLGIPNLEELARYVNTLVGAGLLQPDNELERHLRQAANLPAKEEFVGDEEQPQQPRAGATGERAILRATRASLLMNRLRLLQQQGILTPEQAAPLLERARQEILGALGELDTGEEITPTTAESASKPKTKPAESAGNLKDIEDVLARLEGKKK